MKKLSVLNGLSWLTGKISFLRKCGDTFAASLTALDLFKSEYVKIWNIKENETKNNQSVELVDPANTVNTIVDEKSNSAKRDKE